MEREDSVCPICGGRIWENESADFCMDCGEVFPKSEKPSAKADLKTAKAD